MRKNIMEKKKMILTTAVAVVFGENPSEQEVNQEIIYNLVSYLPLNEMKIQDGDKISYIVKTARDYKNANGKVEDGALETLEACLKEESGISDIGNAKIYYTSFNKNTNDLIAHGVTRKEADTITDAKAISAAVFIYKGSGKTGNQRRREHGISRDAESSLE